MRKPNWRSPAALSARDRNASLRNPDLSDFGSLTARLKARFGGSFRVEVLRQDYASPTVDERELLGLRAHEVAWIREVALWGGGEVVVRARSVLPLATLRGRTRRLKGLQNRPLGAAIFANPTLLRQRVEIASLALDDSTTQSKRVWARRSLFSLGGKRLLVIEAFLDA